MILMLHFLLYFLHNPSLLVCENGSFDKFHSTNAFILINSV